MCTRVTSHLTHKVPIPNDWGGGGGGFKEKTKIEQVQNAELEVDDEITESVEQ